MTPRLSAAVLALLLAGCGGAGLQDGTTSDTTTATTTTGPTEDPGPGPVAMPLNATWNDCRGIGIAYTYPSGQNPGRPPSGWPPATGGVGSDVDVAAYYCERVHWGRFERPVTMVLESHTNLDPPQACREGDWDTFEALASWWVDDRELADYMRTTYGIPVHYGAIEVTEQSDAATITLTASWNETGTEPSSMSGTEVRQLESGPPVLSRLFWDWGNGTAMLDLTRDAEFSNLQSPVVAATMKPPMLLSGLGLPVVPTTGQAMPTVQLSGDLVLFGDRTCEQPLQ